MFRISENNPKQSTVAFDSGEYSGKWNHSSKGVADGLWIAHSDGRLEVKGKLWKGTWKIPGDGTLGVI